MNPLALPAPARLDVARLGEVPTDVLVAELTRQLKVTADHLAYLAALWAELEARGADLSHLRKGLGAYLPRIAAGDVLAETVVAFAGEPATLKRVAALPAAEQRQIAEGKAPPPAPLYRGPNARPVSLRKEPTLPGMPAKPAPAGEPSDDELDAACAKPALKPLDMLAAMIANAGPRDAAELILAAVKGGADPRAVARQLIPMLEQLVKAPERPKLVI